MTKIEEKARASYFASEQVKRSRIDEYTEAYRKGYMDALHEFKDALAAYPNNKDRLTSISNLISSCENR